MVAETILTTLSWVITAIAFTGTILNSRQNKWGFVFWIISNTGFGILNLYLQIYAQAVFFFVCLIVSIQGFIVWSKKEKEKTNKIEETKTTL